MLQQDGLSFLGPEHGHGDVAIGERLVLHAGRLGVFGTVERIGVHGHQGGEAVSAMDVKSLADRTESMCGIEVAAIFLIELQPPVFPVSLPERIQIVVVGAFGMDDFTENTLLSHGESRELEEIVAAVLKNHAVPAGTLGSVHQIPASLQGFGRRNLDGYMLAVLHGIQGHGNVVYPVGADVNEIHVGVFAERLIRGFLSAVHIGGKALSLKILQALLGTVGFYVTDGGHMAAGHEGETLDGIAAAHSQSYHADAHILNGVGGKLKHVRLTGLARRDRQFDDG